MPTPHHRKSVDHRNAIPIKHNLVQSQLQPGIDSPSSSRHKKDSFPPTVPHRRPSLQTIALLITAGLVFTALLGGFLTGTWEPFRLLCPFALGILAGLLPQFTPPP